MQVALLGLAQAGKKTLFSLLTGREVTGAAKRGETIEGIASVRDPRVDVLSEMYQPEKTIYAENHFVLCPDIAVGSEARTWLDPAQRCDLLCCVIRAFEAPDVYHPNGSVDAARDRAEIQAELILADMYMVETRLENIAKDKRKYKTTKHDVQEQALRLCAEALENEKPLSTLEFSPPHKEAIKGMDLITRKPVMFVENVSEDDIGTPADDGTVTISCAIEKEIAAIEDEEERGEFMAEMGLDSPGLDRVNAAIYDALGLMSFYTLGTDECRAWTIRKGATAPVAGGVIHSDIEHGFIRVQIIRFDDLVAAGSEEAAKQNGRMPLKGKDYVIEDGDLCDFLFNV